MCSCGSGVCALASLYAAAQQKAKGKPSSPGWPLFLAANANLHTLLLLVPTLSQKAVTGNSQASFMLDKAQLALALPFHRHHHSLPTADHYGVERVQDFGLLIISPLAFKIHITEKLFHFGQSYI